MAQFKSKNINALFVWFRLYVIKGYDGQWNIEHLKENLENAEKELRQLENKEVAHSASDNSQMDAILALKKDGISAKDMHDVGWNGAINTVVNVLKRHH